MRKLIALALTALILPFIFGMSTASAGDKLRLPFAYIFSGPFIEFGERVWNEGMVPGVAEVNKNGGMNYTLTALFTTLLSILVYISISRVSKRVQKPVSPIFAGTK